MSGRAIVLIGFHDQPNLGLGYMEAVLAREGFDVECLDVRRGPRDIAGFVLRRNPLLVGLSIIFQYHTPDVASLAANLRAEGYTGFLCAGGHYPSLRHAEVLDAIPQLDCVVRFEGELTLLDLVRRLAEGRDWHDVPSIAFGTRGAVTATPLRPLIGNLDTLPFPARRSFDYECLGIRATAILASRGCPRSCSFCSIRRFYAAPPGPLRRVRSPENVLLEMRHLFDEHRVRIFLFQDDDFALTSRADRARTERFLRLLRISPLGGKVAWKISCRTDEIREDLFAALRDAGLFLVYLGIESGNDRGLETLVKRITVEENVRAVETLQKLGLRFDFGFMLFDPSSTFESVLENAVFLRRICANGVAPAPFCKMLPYAGTDIEERLRREGRLLPGRRDPDYHFLDPRLDAWFSYLSEVFRKATTGPHSLLAQLKWSLFELDVFERFFPGTAGLAKHRSDVAFLTGWYNEVFCRIVEQSAGSFRAADQGSLRALETIRGNAERQWRWLEDTLARQAAAFLTPAGFRVEIVRAEAGV